MKLTIRTPLAILLLSAWSLIGYGQIVPTSQPSHGWWNQRFPGRPQGNPDGKKLPLIRVEKNHFVDPAGNIMLFRGVSISDPDKIEGEGHWNQELFQHIQEMGATIVRIPVHPVAWRGRTPAKYLQLLDQAVQWCTDLHMYVIIDWHSIGNLKMELFQDPMYDTTQRETYEFWRTIARHFRGDNTVAFYELFNEPTTFRGQLGNISWTDWKEINENIIRLIRAYDTERIPLVAGFDWAYDLTPLREQPIAAEGIGYVTHPYANKRPKPWEPKWEEDFGFAAAKYPIIATEIGFELRNGEKIDADHYGNRIVNYLESKGISWVAWDYDPEWGPRLLKSWNYDLTASGEFFEQAMHREIAKQK
ncbi:MAG TPA: cellulase family glycosylhydrolase [Tepidisphaeraceae bacterium]|jgi:aryl-phospho-beta-D-glucosidase BglC (GH1 family)|nr:cellulase family glycosylhydrolase [Tepidisphaeraceae bacterium]